MRKPGGLWRPLLRTPDGTMAGMGLWEMKLSEGLGSNSGHAAQWETSNLQFFIPQLVNMAERGDGPLNLGMSPPSGIGGLIHRRMPRQKSNS